MKKLYFLLLFGAFSTVQAFSQGCVPIRSTGSSGMFDRPNSSRKSQPPKWTFSATNRYFKSFRHFVGDVEQKQRLENGTEVINKSYTLDLNAVRTFNKRWSVSMDIPLIANNRSSLYEHGGTDRHSTQSVGIGDARFTAYRWLLDPKKSKKGNIQAGLGIKLPTGDYKVKDAFYDGTSKISGPVDQSIQLGDGGTGLITELNSYYTVSRKVSIYSNLYYLVNPRETNGVSTARGKAATAASITYGSDIMSVPDQYMARAGASMVVKKFTLSAGVRIDGVPAEDVIGGSSGFRRPGYVIAAEPGVVYRTKKISAFLNAPIAIERNRIQSLPDKVRSELTKTYYKGDASFADYVINLGISFSIPNTKYKKGNFRPGGNYRYYYPRSYNNSPQKRVVNL